MKRLLCLLLVLSLLLCGCSTVGKHIKEPVTFHYLCSRYHEELCCVIVSEEREISGHAGDLAYFLALYLMGPTNDELRSPLPYGTEILSVQQTEETVTIEFSDLDRKLSDIDFSLAGACLTMTCLEIVHADNVTIRSGTRSVTMNSSSLSLFDSSAETAQEEETE